MLKRLVNELHCTLTLRTCGPVLIKSGHASISGPDMTPVRTYRNGEWQVYLPGSSLKGVLRSHLEKICRSLRPEPDGIVCNPFYLVRDFVCEEAGLPVCPQYDEVFCGDKFELRSKGEVRVKDRMTDRTWRIPNPQSPENNIAYADSCPICRLFGSTAFIGRLSIEDAYLAPDQPGRTETRDGVGIDRLTGGAAHSAKFDLEVVSTGTVFQTDILIRNFECWQVGMLLTAIADLHDELIRIGSGRSRGLGAVRGEIHKVTIHTLAPTSDKPVNQVWGLGRFLTKAEYGTYQDDQLILVAEPEVSKRGLRSIATFEGESLQSLCDAAQQEFVQRLEQWHRPQDMRWRTDWQRSAHVS